MQNPTYHRILEAQRHFRVTPSVTLGWKDNRPIPLACQPQAHPHAIQFIHFISLQFHVINWQGLHPQTLIFDDYNMVLGLPIAPPTKQQRIQMTPPHGPQLVCPSFLLVGVEIASKDPPPQLVVANNDVV